jgi:hypothetical protein
MMRMASKSSLRRKSPNVETFKVKMDGERPHGWSLVL